MQKMSTAAKTAIGGMMTAISVVILMPTVFETFTYALPLIASFLIMLCVVELGKQWAFGVYAAVSIISLIIVPNKEATVMYAAVFGYYPILKAIFESKLPKIVEYILKFAVFNVAVVAATLLLIKVFGVPFNEMMGIENEASFFGRYAVPILLVIGNIAFALMDFAMTRWITVYLRFWQKKFHKIFRFK